MKLAEWTCIYCNKNGNNEPAYGKPFLRRPRAWPIWGESLCACMGAGVLMSKDWGDLSTSCPHKTLSNPPLIALIGSSYSIWTQLCRMTRSQTESNTNTVTSPQSRRLQRWLRDDCVNAAETHTHTVSGCQLKQRETVHNEDVYGTITGRYSHNLSIKKYIF